MQIAYLLYIFIAKLDAQPLSIIDCFGNVKTNSIRFGNTL